MKAKADHEQRRAGQEESAEVHPAITKLRERKQRHRERSWVARYAVVILGVLITLAGAVMTGPVPGPGLLVIPIGLALLALQFDWAESLYEKAVVWADDAKEQATSRSKKEKVISGVVAVLAVAAFVVAAILWDIPLLPV